MRVSDILREGKARLDRLGWGQGGGSMQGPGPRCALGALNADDTESVADPYHSISSDAVAYLAEAAVNTGKIPRWLRARGSSNIEYVYVYNDTAPTRTAIDLIYDRAIARAERDEAKVKVNEMIAELEAWVNDPSPVEISKIPVDTLVAV